MSKWPTFDLMTVGLQGGRCVYLRRNSRIVSICLLYLFKTRNCVSKTRKGALKTRNFVLKMMSLRRAMYISHNRPHNSVVN